MNPVSAIHWIVEVPLRPLDGVPPWLSLALLALVTGVGMLIVVGRLTDQKRLEVARDHMSSAIYEMRLFMDSPIHILRAQLRFVRASFRYTLLAMPPLFVLAAPLGLLFLHLEARYELAPLPAGATTVVTVETLRPVAAGDVRVAPNDAVRLTAPPLVAGDEIHLRVEIEKVGVHRLEMTVGDEEVSKLLVALPGAPVSPVRAAGWGFLLDVSTEAPLDAVNVSAIRVEHPRESLIVLGMPWWLYWLGLTMAAAMAFRRPLGVVL